MDVACQFHQLCIPFFFLSPTNEKPTKTKIPQLHRFKTVNLTLSTYQLCTRLIFENNYLLLHGGTVLKIQTGLDGNQDTVVAVSRMFLVPYGGSDISDSDGEDDPTGTQVEIITPVVTKIVPVVPPEPEEKSFLDLPAPKTTDGFSILEEEVDDEFLQKKPAIYPKEKNPVKITIPTLSQPVDATDETPIKKFRSASAKGTGLFSLLPAPKAVKATLIIPQSVKRALAAPRAPSAAKPTTLKATPVESTKTAVETEPIDDDDAIDAGPCDFFSLDKHPDDVPQDMPAAQPAIIPQLEPEVNAELHVEPTAESGRVIGAENCEGNVSGGVTTPFGLDEEALRTLCGPRGKRRKEITAEILDLNESDIRPANDEWLQQAILHGTGPDENSPATASKSAPGGILKRKHQITYLAHQAKANEQQLKNTWAQNRATRQQTQSKYGF